jgi:hypothetical protein
MISIINVGDYHMELSKALRKTADLIESNDYGYQWSFFENCNCGCLARTIADNYFDDDGRWFRDERQKLGRLPLPMVQREDWTGIAEYAFCNITKLPVDSIFRTLFKIGIRHKDIYELEFLANPEIRTRAGLPLRDCFSNMDHKSRENVIIYMRAWADMLDEKEIITKSAPAKELIAKPRKLKLRKEVNV